MRKNTEYFLIMALISNDDYKSSCYGVGMDGFALKSCFHLDYSESIKKLSEAVNDRISQSGFGSIDIA